MDEDRLTHKDLRCVKCGPEANADYNAAKNIDMRYVDRGQQLFRRADDNQPALKSETVTLSGGLTTHQKSSGPGPWISPPSTRLRNVEWGSCPIIYTRSA